MKIEHPYTRRKFLKTLAILAAGTAALSASPWLVLAEDLGYENRPWLKKVIPTSGEKIPVIGMGTWLTFNVKPGHTSRDQRVDVLREFFRLGGGLIDSSPMYGFAEDMMGYGLDKIDSSNGLFSATKIWTFDAVEGPQQVQNSKRLWGLDHFDLIQIHNLLNWPAHLETLNRLKAEGTIRYIGMTTSHGRRHDELENILLTQNFDFLQITYNILDRAVEDRILPLAQEQGMAVIANRPFQGGRLMDSLQRHPLPDWAVDFDCTNWAQFLLKFIVSHPAVTCAIPATTRIDHMRENMGAAYGRLPTLPERQRMIKYIQELS